MDSPLHERYRPDVEELRPGYISVDTGKLTLGPLMATRAVELARRENAAAHPGDERGRSGKRCAEFCSGGCERSAERCGS